MDKSFEISKIKTISVSNRYVPAAVDLDIDLNEDGAHTDVSTMNMIRVISKLAPIKTCAEYFEPMSSHLNIHENDKVRWDLMVDKTSNRAYFEYLKKQLQYSQNLLTSYYGGLYQRRVKTYQELTPVYLGGNILEVPSYNHASVTGRTSITEGFNFLTLSKEKRKQLKPAEDDCVLIEIDLKSCEPNFYLKSLGRKVSCEDVYADIAEHLGMKINDRARFKRGILSVMYGAKDTTSKNMLRCTFSDLRKIKEYFQIEAFKSYLEEEFEKNGVIYNYYGRPICFDNSLVNYWIQSSSVDYCSLAFSNLINDLSLRPCFFVHDSMTVSVKKDDVDSVMSIGHVYDDYSNITIPVEVCLLSE